MSIVNVKVSWGPFNWFEKMISICTICGLVIPDGQERCHMVGPTYDGAKSPAVKPEDASPMLTTLNKQMLEDRKRQIAQMWDDTSFFRTTNTFSSKKDFFIADDPWEIPKDVSPAVKKVWTEAWFKQLYHNTIGADKLKKGVPRGKRKAKKNNR